MKCFIILVIFINISLSAASAFGRFQQSRFEKQRDLIIKLSESELKGETELCSFFVQQFNDSLHLNKMAAGSINKDPAEVQELNSEEICE